MMNYSKTDQSEDRKKKEFLVVGIGASAGGVQALQEFFRNIAPDSGLAYVVILHLSPDHDSLLAEILQLVTKMPVGQVTENTEIWPDHVYVVPPNKSLIISHNMITASPVETVEERRAPVDIFLRSLADSHGARAVAVILSGTGANGSMGIKRIKENGGFVLVQKPSEAQFDEMPMNTIHTGLADDILPVAQIPAKLKSISERSTSLLSLTETLHADDAHHAHLREIFTQLRTRTGHDFSNYKRATMLRRIERRMNFHNLTSVADYAALVRKQQDEAQALLKDLLISVTNFFRDKDSFEYLESTIIPEIIAKKNPGESIRVWVTGCATGEEAYSLAMIFSEQLGGLPESPAIQIFATDIDEHAISIAREGLYTLNDAADVSPERLRNFFIKEGDEFRVRRELRDMILFANHNIIKDPPFSYLDLATCRNLLIYLNHSAQKRVMETLHFALRPNAYLFIGSSESIDGSANLYVAQSKDHHVFQTRSLAIRTFPVADKYKTPQLSDQPMELPAISKKTIADRITYNELHQRLLEQYAPPSVVVNQDFDIVHLSENAGRYLQIVGGEPSNNLLKMVRQELRIDLRSGLYQAIRQQANVELRNLSLSAENGGESVNIHVRPVMKKDDPAAGFLLVVFEDSTDQSESIPVRAVAPGPVAEHLEAELVRSKFQLRNSVEQYEVQAEELKASNEELQAMNEELRSAAEELETSKEELQSINEELVTVNQELKVKIDELSQSNNNFHNVINSTDIGTIFLDRGLRVNLFTPTVRAIFNLIPSDIGRPLSDISSKLADADIIRDAETVMERLVLIERELKINEEEYYMMRVLPYRTAEDHINGVVITFVNITRLKASEKLVRETEQQQRFLLELGDKLSVIPDSEKIVEQTLKAIGHRLSLDTAIYAELFDEMQSPVVVSTWQSEAGETDTAEKYSSTVFKDAVNQLRSSDQVQHAGKNPYVFLDAEINRAAVVIPLRENGKVRAYFYLLQRDGLAWKEFDLNLVREASERSWNLIQKNKLEKNRQRSEEHLRFVMESIAEYAIITTDTNGMITGWNPGAEQLFGYNQQEIMGQHFEVLFTPEDRLQRIPFKEIQTAIEFGRAEDERWHIKKDGTRFYLSGVTNRLRYGADGLVKIARDMTAGKLLEQQKDQFIGIASHELKTPVTSIKAYAEVLHDMFLEAGDQKSAGLMTRLDSQVDRLTVLIGHLLDTTRITEGQLLFQPETFDISELIVERAQDLQTITLRHKIVLEPGPAGIVQADKERLGQVLTNLISNAIKYSPDGGDIVITSMEVESGIQVSIKDSGIGMSPESLEKIFERFFRTTNPAIQTYPGLGLGLYISSEIIKRHGGRIWVESKPGQGSTFYFVIPKKSGNA